MISLSINPTFARVVNRNFTPEGDEHSIQLISLTHPFNFSSSMSISLKTNFRIGNGIALVIIPADFGSKFATNMSFEALDAYQFLDIKFYANVCTISSSNVTNVSKISNVMNVMKNEANLSSLIEYEPVSKRIEIRLTKLGDPNPVEPLISVLVDLGEILKGKEVMLGLASSNEKHKHIISWGMKIKDVQGMLTSSFGDLQEHVLPVIRLEHSTSTIEPNKEKSENVSSFMIGVIGSGVLLAALVTYALCVVMCVGVQMLELLIIDMELVLVHLK
ncbi:uncharacterized protein LOC143569343 [Bidens hawaiensis]|uniref:uncharacterized protein LOC143569343 n=1 Tax=Bidens hawaiensis TaxID=980011 RepID=UPI00404AEB0C